MKKAALKLIPAVCMLLISAMMLGTTTYAWFSMSNQVQATGMQVQAKAESGLVIRNAETTQSGVVYNNWSTASPAQHADPVLLIPTSTADLVHWYHNQSSLISSAMPNQSTGYTLEETLTSRADEYNSDLFACYKYYIKTTDAHNLTVTSLRVKQIAVTFPDTQQSTNLNKALRVGVIAVPGDTGMGGGTNGDVLAIYAPVDGATTSYHVNHDSSTITANGKDTPVQLTNVTSIPFSDLGLAVYIYIWFEGEDNNCRSSNVTATLDNLQVAVTFDYTN